MTAHSNIPARRIRRDGWTVERQEAFLKALASCGCVSDACRAVGMSRQSVHNLYNHPSARGFRMAYDAALDSSLRLVEDGMFSRAIKGVPRPIFYQGEQVGEYRHFDERLGMFLLRYRRPHRYAAIATLPPPRVPPGCEDLRPDPDEPVIGLDFHLGDLVDDAEMPEGGVEFPTMDGVNFVNLTPATDAGPGDADAAEGRVEAYRSSEEQRPGDA